MTPLDAAIPLGSGLPTSRPKPSGTGDRPWRFGPRLHDGGIEFRLWAPLAGKVRLKLEGGPVLDMQAEDGWHRLDVERAGAGALYRFVLDDGTEIPDPASRFQPADVHGPSEVVDLDAFPWSDEDWIGRRWSDTVIYELHVGTFTPEGTFAAAIDRLPALAELGINAIELMPIADFPGRWNWGYDGVLPFAPDARYGRPEELMRLVDAAHGLGIQVFLDVVYNHFGPEGNYLPLYAPVFDERHHTAWGSAVNYSGEGSEAVRRFIVENARHWILAYHLDGLRLDAVHAILDDNPRHVLEELSTSVREATGRTVHLILENEENEPRWLERDASGRTLYEAQWNDDVHHALHCALTGQSSGYYGDYLGDTEKLGRALAEGFTFQGEVMPYRGSSRGAPSAHLPPTAFVAFLQNHDQVGNRAFGDRLASLTSTEALRAATSILLLLPQIPMLFMGDEWGTRRPFLFFTDPSDALKPAIQEGRRKEFERFPEFSDPETLARIPDPTAEQTFLASKLDWSEASTPEGRAVRERIRALLAVRRREIAALIAEPNADGSYEVIGTGGAVAVRWAFEAGTLELLANLSDTSVLLPREPAGRTLWQEGEIGEGSLGPWSAMWTFSAAAR